MIFDAEERKKHKDIAVAKISADSQYGTNRLKETAIVKDMEDHPYVFDSQLFAKFKEDHQHEWQAEFVTSLKKYRLKIEQQNLNNQERAQITRAQAEDSVVEQIVSGYVHIMSSMLKKVRGVADKNQLVKSSLNALVTLEATGQTLTQCYEKGILSGIVQIVKNKYGKASFVRFRNELDLCMDFKMSQEMTRDDPMKGVAQISATMSNWISMRYWQYMTFDVFWACILLSSMWPKDPLRLETVRVVNNFIREQISEKGEEGLLSDDQNELPIFKKAVEVIEGWQSSAKMGSSHSQQKQPVESESKESYKTVLKKLSREEAASASGDITKFTFTKPIDRACGVEYTLDNGNVVAYTATKEPCSKCWTKSKVQGGKMEQNEASGYHTPRCCSNNCNKCKYFGHLKPDCAQKYVNGDLKASNSSRVRQLDNDSEEEGHVAHVRFEEASVVDSEDESDLARAHRISAFYIDLNNADSDEEDYHHHIEDPV
eukprot:gene38921-48061_t